MGSSFSSAYKRAFGRTETHVLMMGLYGSGKTTILYKLRLGEVVTTIPTIGMNMETVDNKKWSVSLTCFDMGGRCPIRPLWRHFYIQSNINCVVFVFDSSDRDQGSVEQAKDELHYLMHEDLLREFPLLVFANKQDLPAAMSSAEIEEQLNLPSLTRPWKVQQCSADTGDGLFEGFDWLSSVLQARPTAPKAEAYAAQLHAKRAAVEAEWRRLREEKASKAIARDAREEEKGRAASVAETDSTADTEALDQEL